VRYLRDLREEHGEAGRGVWAGFAQSIFNLGEFVTCGKEDSRRK